MIAERRCTCCGVQDSRTLSGKQYCIPCNERQTESGRRRRKYLKSVGRCVSCTAKDSRTESGLALCDACASADMARARVRQNRKRSERVCTKCGVQDSRTLAGSWYCERCRLKINEYQKTVRRREKEDGKL